VSSFQASWQLQNATANSLGLRKSGDKMGIPTIFILFLIFLFIFHHNLKKTEKLTAIKRKEFWENEEKSMFSRKSQIEDTNYIVPDISGVKHNNKEYFAELGHPELFKYQELIFSLSKEPMLNLSNMSNSEIRLKYGIANFSHIEACENNYNRLIKAIYLLGKGYFDLENYSEAISVLEAGIKINSDISDHILLLAELYAKKKDSFNFNELKIYSENLESLTKSKLSNGFIDLKKRYFI